ncbi:hypothetical protein [Lentisalinibacter salinarum]|uniref:hypothetical protein n=1 Tax=Lentisalinibacter salinarum TaxID=2992239 RepID=UPI003866F86B
MNDSQLERTVSEYLLNAEINFDQNALINGFVADFVAYGPDEQFAIVETKSWLWHAGNIARAGDLAASIQERTGAAAVFVVLDRLDKNWPSRNVYRPEGVADAIKNWVREHGERIAGGTRKRKLKILGKGQKKLKTLFAAMPFERQFDDTFVIAMTKAAEAIDGKAIRVDQEAFTEAIVDRVKKDIAECAVLVADVSKSNPNVLYELGYARGLGIPCVQVSSSSLSELPFDIRHYPTQQYTIGAVNRLVPELINTVKKVAL